MHVLPALTCDACRATVLTGPKLPNSSLMMLVVSWCVCGNPATNRLHPCCKAAVPVLALMS